MSPGLQHLCEAVRPSSKHWETSGSTWHTLASLWLCAEVALGKSHHTDLSFKQIHESIINSQWKDWMCVKLMKMDMAPPLEAFGNIFTDYIPEPPVTTPHIGGSVMEEVWCPLENLALSVSYFASFCRQNILVLEREHHPS